MKKLIKVYGIDCIACTEKLEQALSTFKDVEAEVDMDMGIVTVSSEVEYADEVLLTKIKQAGFEAVII